MCLTPGWKRWTTLIKLNIFRPPPRCCHEETTSNVSVCAKAASESQSKCEDWKVTKCLLKGKDSMQRKLKLTRNNERSRKARWQGWVEHIGRVRWRVTKTAQVFHQKWKMKEVKCKTKSRNVEPMNAVELSCGKTNGSRNIRSKVKNKRRWNVRWKAKERKQQECNHWKQFKCLVKKTKDESNWGIKSKVIDEKRLHSCWKVKASWRAESRLNCCLENKIYTKLKYQLKVKQMQTDVEALRAVEVSH